MYKIVTNYIFLGVDILDIDLNELENIHKYKNGWFACAVTRDYEMKVYNELKKLLDNDYWNKYIYDIFLPMKKTTDRKGNEKIIIIPELKGVIYIKMMLTPEVYNVIKIDGFRTPLPAKEPIPLKGNEVDKALKYRIQ